MSAPSPADAPSDAPTEARSGAEAAAPPPESAPPSGRRAPGPRISQWELVTGLAMMFSMVALSIDSLLPALPDIAAELSPAAPNKAQLVVPAFILGLGIGTILSGPLSDAYGRRAVTNGGIALFVLASIAAWAAPDLPWLLAARALQGLAVAGPRIAPMAAVRDLYEGRRMASITSLVSTVFLIVPAIAPSVGAAIRAAFGWRAIFLVLMAFAALAALWMRFRLGETHPPERRRPFRPARLREGFMEVMGNRTVRIVSLALSLQFGALMALISTTQQVYSTSFGRAESFPLWFAATALVGAAGTLLNARLVGRFGMRRLALLAFALETLLSLGALAGLAALAATGALSQGTGFAIWFVWSSSVLFFLGFVMGNLNAIALQPLGHLAGMGTSVIAAVYTVAGGLLSVPVGLAFNGTPLPLIGGALLLFALGWLLLALALKGK